MGKRLHKAIMKKSRLQNKFLKIKLARDTKNFNVQQNCRKKQMRSTEKLYFSNLNRIYNDSKCFWKTTVTIFFEIKKLKK